LPVDLDSNRYPEGWIAVEVVGRPIERIKNPADAAPSRLVRAFLTEDAVFRALPQNMSNHDPFGFQVNVADQVEFRRFRS
jgi:hypothetical protein